MPTSVMIFLYSLFYVNAFTLLGSDRPKDSSLALCLFATNIVEGSQRTHPSRWQHGQGAAKSIATHTPGVLVTRSEKNESIASERNLV